MRPPRLDAADRQRKRFYEPLILLSVLEPVQGERIPEQLDVYHPEESRNRHKVLSSLCEMCDYTKGGNSVTALAVQLTPAGPVYWVASNQQVERRIVPFLMGILERLGEFGQSIAGEEEIATFEEALFRSFTLFNRKRMRETCRLFQIHLGNEFSRLRRSEDQTHIQGIQDSSVAFSRLDLTTARLRKMAGYLPERGW
jgi:hypothetical protein